MSAPPNLARLDPKVSRTRGHDPLDLAIGELSTLGLARHRLHYAVSDRDGQAG
jgi:hypothetical protein